MTDPLLQLGGERGVALAREYGYADGSGVTQAIKRLQARAATDKVVANKLNELAKLSIVND
ncbi:MAG: hypothetical protein ABSD58_20160 [Verrucomicrobiia bacterium]|jgi:hypothetical protein